MLSDTRDIFHPFNIFFALKKSESDMKLLNSLGVARLCPASSSTHTN